MMFEMDVLGFAYEQFTPEQRNPLSEPTRAVPGFKKDITDAFLQVHEPPGRPSGLLVTVFMRKRTFSPAAQLRLRPGQPVNAKIVSSLSQ